MDRRKLFLFSAASLFLLSDFSDSIDGLKLKTGASLSTRRPVDPSRVERISRQPRAFIYRGFLTIKECNHLITLAKDHLKKSKVIDEITGDNKEDNKQRTSHGMFLSRKQDEIVAEVEERIAAWTFLPLENGECLQILRYELGQKYDPHLDYFEDEINLKNGGNRIATVLIYLSDVAKGGETVFPESMEKHTQPKGDDWSDCAKQGYAVKPKKGDALLFFDLHLNHTFDPSSYHGSCPVIEGVKWSATKWIHARARFEDDDADVDEGDDDGECTDEDDECPYWASNGECEKNPAFMLGTHVLPGHCKKSCGACS